MTTKQNQTANNKEAQINQSDDATQQQDTQCIDMSYEEYLKLANPYKSDEEVSKMIRKENRYTWLGRFQILALLAIVILVIVLICIK